MRASVRPSVRPCLPDWMTPLDSPPTAQRSPTRNQMNMKESIVFLFSPLPVGASLQAAAAAAPHITMTTVSRGCLFQGRNLSFHVM